jgi:glycosyltransferase involved in cell wall biosynthesis
VKIGYVVGSYPNRSERFIEREIRALREMGAEIRIHPIACGEGFVCPWCVLGRHAWLSVLPSTWRGVRRFPFGSLAGLRWRAWKEFPGGVSRASRIAREMAAEGVEHVHAHFAGKPAAVGMMAAAMLGVPFSLSAHARDVFAEATALRHKVRMTEWTAVCSRAALKHLTDRTPRDLHARLHLVRHGLDLSDYPFRGTWRPHEPVRLLAAGRFVEKKGLRYLVDAMAGLRDCVLDLAGAGPLGRDLRQQVERLGLGERVRFLGWLDPAAVRKKMAESDLLVVPSVVAKDGDRDGVPNVLLEAGALGLPVVACDAGGIDEFVLNDETGRLMAPREAGRIAGAVRSAVATPAVTEQFAAAARKKVENEYDLRENARLLMDLFTRPGRHGP